MRVKPSIVLACALMAAPALNAQDVDVGFRQARRVPEWMNKLTIYQEWLRSFSPAGNLKGVTARLPYTAELGAGLVYLSPIAKQSDGAWAMPYNVTDYNRIDPEYGTDADLHELVSVAHKLGLKVMLDVVYYHTTADATVVDKPGFVIRTPDGKPEAGYWKQPRPDFNNPEVRRFLVDSLVHWAKDFQVDGFRCDVADAVPLSFWEEARRRAGPRQSGADSAFRGRSSSGSTQGLRHQLQLRISINPPQGRSRHSTSRAVGKRPPDDAAGRTTTALHRNARLAERGGRIRGDRRQDSADSQLHARRHPVRFCRAGDRGAHACPSLDQVTDSRSRLHLRRRLPEWRWLRAPLRRREHGHTGIVAVTVNYRTNIFGFFSHPELTKESPHHASGNYGLLDQVAALHWVQRNIAAFGGDPKHVTIAGESAGSLSVSALMASPLSKDLFIGAIGESGRSSPLCRRDRSPRPKPKARVSPLPPAPHP